jgi:hypothetical protein
VTIIAIELHCYLVVVVVVVVVVAVVVVVVDIIIPVSFFANCLLLLCNC